MPRPKGSKNRSRDVDVAFLHGPQPAAASQAPAANFGQAIVRDAHDQQRPVDSAASHPARRRSRTNSAGRDERQWETDGSKVTLPKSSEELQVQREYLPDVLQCYETLRRLANLVHLTPFSFESLCHSLAYSERNRLLADVHVALLTALLQDDQQKGVHYTDDPDQLVSIELQLALWDSLTWPCILFTYLQADKTFAYSHILESGIEWHYPKGPIFLRIAVLSHLCQRVSQLSSAACVPLHEHAMRFFSIGADKFANQYVFACGTVFVISKKGIITAYYDTFSQLQQLLIAVIKMDGTSLLVERLRKLFPIITRHLTSSKSTPPSTAMMQTAQTIASGAREAMHTTGPSAKKPGTDAKKPGTDAKKPGTDAKAIANEHAATAPSVSSTHADNSLVAVSSQAPAISESLPSLSTALQTAGETLPGKRMQGAHKTSTVTPSTPSSVAATSHAASLGTSTAAVRGLLATTMLASPSPSTKYHSTTLPVPLGHPAPVEQLPGQQSMASSSTAVTAPTTSAPVLPMPAMVRGGEGTLRGGTAALDTKLPLPAKAQAPEESQLLASDSRHRSTLSTVFSEPQQQHGSVGEFQGSGEKPIPICSGSSVSPGFAVPLMSSTTTSAVAGSITGYMPSSGPSLATQSATTTTALPSVPRLDSPPVLLAMEGEPGPATHSISLGASGAVPASGAPTPLDTATHSQCPVPSSHASRTSVASEGSSVQLVAAAESHIDVTKDTKAATSLPKQSPGTLHYIIPESSSAFAVVREHESYAEARFWCRDGKLSVAMEASNGEVQSDSSSSHDEKKLSLSARRRKKLTRRLADPSIPLGRPPLAHFKKYSNGDNLQYYTDQLVRRREEAQAKGFTMSMVDLHAVANNVPAVASTVRAFLCAIEAQIPMGVKCSQWAGFRDKWLNAVQMSHRHEQLSYLLDVMVRSLRDAAFGRHWSTTPSCIRWVRHEPNPSAPPRCEQPSNESATASHAGTPSALRLPLSSCTCISPLAAMSRQARNAATRRPTVTFSPSPSERADESEQSQAEQMDTHDDSKADVQPTTAGVDIPGKDKDVPMEVVDSGTLKPSAGSESTAGLPDSSSEGSLASTTFRSTVPRHFSIVLERMSPLRSQTTSEAASPLSSRPGSSHTRAAACDATSQDEVHSALSSQSAKSTVTAAVSSTANSAKPSPVASDVKEEPVCASDCSAGGADRSLASERCSTDDDDEADLSVPSLCISTDGDDLYDIEQDSSAATTTSMAKKCQRANTDRSSRKMKPRQLPSSVHSWIHISPRLARMTEPRSSGSLPRKASTSMRFSRSSTPAKRAYLSPEATCLGRTLASHTPTPGVALSPETVLRQNFGAASRPTLPSGLSEDKPVEAAFPTPASSASSSHASRGTDGSRTSTGGGDFELYGDHSETEQTPRVAATASSAGDSHDFPPMPALVKSDSRRSSKQSPVTVRSLSPTMPDLIPVEQAMDTSEPCSVQHGTDASHDQDVTNDSTTSGLPHHVTKSDMLGAGPKPAELLSPHSVSGERGLPLNFSIGSPSIASTLLLPISSVPAAPRTLPEISTAPLSAVTSTRSQQEVATAERPLSAVAKLVGRSALSLMPTLPRMSACDKCKKARHLEQILKKVGLRKPPIEKTQFAYRNEVDLAIPSVRTSPIPSSVLTPSPSASSQQSSDKAGSSTHPVAMETGGKYGDGCDGLVLVPEVRSVEGENPLSDLSPHVATNLAAMEASGERQSTSSQTSIERNASGVASPPHGVAIQASIPSSPSSSSLLPISSPSEDTHSSLTSPLLDSGAHGEVAHKAFHWHITKQLVSQLYSKCRRQARTVWHLDSINVRRLARRAGVAQVHGFSYDNSSGHPPGACSLCQTSRGCEAFPRPSIGRVWRWKMRNITSFSSIAMQIRCLHACLDWPAFVRLSSRFSLFRSVQLDDGSRLRRTLMKRRDIDDWGVKSKYFISYSAMGNLSEEKPADSHHPMEVLASGDNREGAENTAVKSHRKDTQISTASASHMNTMSEIVSAEKAMDTADRMSRPPSSSKTSSNVKDADEPMQTEVTASGDSVLKTGDMAKETFTRSTTGKSSPVKLRHTGSVGASEAASGRAGGALLSTHCGVAVQAGASGWVCGACVSLDELQSCIYALSASDDSVRALLRTKPKPFDSVSTHVLGPKYQLPSVTLPCSGTAQKRRPSAEVKKSVEDDEGSIQGTNGPSPPPVTMATVAALSSSSSKAIPATGGKTLSTPMSLLSTPRSTATASAASSEEADKAHQVLPSLDATIRSIQHVKSPSVAGAVLPIVKASSASHLLSTSGSRSPNLVVTSTLSLTTANVLADLRRTSPSLVGNAATSSKLLYSGTKSTAMANTTTSASSSRPGTGLNTAVAAMPTSVMPGGQSTFSQTVVTFSSLHEKAVSSPRTQPSEKAKRHSSQSAVTTDKDRAAGDQVEKDMATATQCKPQAQPKQTPQQRHATLTPTSSSTALFTASGTTRDGDPVCLPPSLITIDRKTNSDGRSKAGSASLTSGLQNVFLVAETSTSPAFTVFAPAGFDISKLVINSTTMVKSKPSSASKATQDTAAAVSQASDKNTRILAGSTMSTSLPVATEEASKSSQDVTGVTPVTTGDGKDAATAKPQRAQTAVVGRAIASLAASLALQPSNSPPPRPLWKRKKIPRGARSFKPVHQRRLAPRLVVVPPATSDASGSKARLSGSNTAHVKPKRATVASSLAPAAAPATAKSDSTSPILPSFVQQAFAGDLSAPLGEIKGSLAAVSILSSAATTTTPSPAFIMPMSIPSSSESLPTTGRVAKITSAPIMSTSSLWSSPASSRTSPASKMAASATASMVPTDTGTPSAAAAERPLAQSRTPRKSPTMSPTESDDAASRIIRKLSLPPIKVPKTVLPVSPVKHTNKVISIPPTASAATTLSTVTPLVTSTKRVRPPADEPVAVSPAAKRPKAMMPKGKKGEAAIVVNSRSNKATKEQQPPSRSSASKTTRSAVAGKAAPASPVKVITSASKATPVAKSTTPVAKSTSPVARKTTSASRSITSAAKIFSVGSSSPVKESPPSAESTPAADVVTSRNQPASAVKTRHDSSNESREKSKAMETPHEQPADMPVRPTEDEDDYMVDDSLHCVCKEPWNSKRFYIACDICDGWFHTTCLEIRKSDARNLAAFVCTTCATETTGRIPRARCRHGFIRTREHEIMRRKRHGTSLDLPMRRVKTTDDEYCICRQKYDNSRLYIGCEECKDWYHLECVNLTMENIANMSSYICGQCQLPKEPVVLSPAKITRQSKLKSSPGASSDSPASSAAATPSPQLRAMRKVSASGAVSNLSTTVQPSPPVGTKRKTQASQDTDSPAAKRTDRPSTGADALVGTEMDMDIVEESGGDAATSSLSATPTVKTVAKLGGMEGDGSAGKALLAPPDCDSPSPASSSGGFGGGSTPKEQSKQVKSSRSTPATRRSTRHGDDTSPKSASESNSPSSKDVPADKSVTGVASAVPDWGSSRQKTRYFWSYEKGALSKQRAQQLEQEQSWVLSPPDVTSLLETLEELKEKPSCAPFLEPVNIEATKDYLKIVSEPMDFGTVTQKLTLGAYHTLADFRRDVNLIFSNCRRYNRKSSLIFKDALFLSRTFGNILASWKHDRTAATGDGDEAERSGEAFDESADAIAVAAEEDENIGEESE